MQQEFADIGKLFKTKREEMNLSLKEVENATSIRTSQLASIEEGKKDNFLSSVYVLGFVRQYASFLGLDGDKIIEDNPKAFIQKPVDQEFSYGIGTLETRGAPKGSSRLFPNLLWVGFGVGALVLAWYFAKFLGVV